MHITKMIFLMLLSMHALESHSHSFFRPRDVSTDSALELNLSNYDRYRNQDTRINFYVKPFFMKSTHGKKLARYFLPHNKSCVSIDESGAGDIDSLWLNLISPAGSFYTSNITLSPQRTLVGALLTLYFNFCQDWWLGINTAVMHSKNNAHLCEYNRTEEGTVLGFANAYKAFNNPTWTAGRITNSNQKKAGLDDIQIKLGFDFSKTEEEHTSLYLVGTIPTGNFTKSLYLFEPLIGSKHGSFGVGFNSDMQLYACDEHQFNFMFDFKYRYIFAAYERRSFDLLPPNGDWSRYLLVVTPAQPTNSQPGINLLTVPARVIPRNTVDVWANVHYQWCNWNVELGYEFWWRQSERICKACPLATGYGIQTLTLCSPNLLSASTANISQGAQGANATVTDSQFIFITNANLDLASGAQAASHSQKLFADVGYTFTRAQANVIAGLGASYEFSTKNALNQYALWVLLGVDF